MYITEGISFKLLKKLSKSICLSANTEAVLVEVKINKKKWLLWCSYAPHKALIEKYMNELGNPFDIYLQKYNHALLIGKLNSERSISERSMHDFCNVYNLESLSKTPTCFKTPKDLSCIDLLLTNSKKNFDEKSALESCLSDFDKLVKSVLKICFEKEAPKVSLAMKSSVINLKMNLVK